MINLFKTPLSVLIQSATHWKNSMHHSSALDIAKQRVMIIGCTVMIAFLSVIIRLGDVMLFKHRERAHHIHAFDFEILRADITDAHHHVIATNVMTASAYANPKQMIDIKDAAQKLSKVLKDTTAEELEQKLKNGKTFVWLARHISPKMQADILNLGIPGVSMYKDQTRIYPHGRLTSHVVGMCGMDGNGLSGVESYFDTKLQECKDPLELTIDLRVQHILHTEVAKGIHEFSAVGGNAIALNVKTGEILGMVSFPDFDPNTPSQSYDNAFFNRNTLGVYEPGSVFKILNVAIALETGKANLNSIFDGSQPVQIGKFKVTDFKGLNRPMTLAEAFVRSSNIASIKISQQFGTKIQQDYMKRFGVLDRLNLELPELGAPMIPKDWTPVSMMTISYGYGISQTPLQILSVVNGIINDGVKIAPTLIKRKDFQDTGVRILSEKTARIVRTLMRQVVEEGTARKANIPGYRVFGKTGTTYQKQKGGYGSEANRSRTTTFIGGFPYDDPQVLLIVMLDNPKATSKTAGYATAGWNAALVAGNIIEKVAPLFVAKEDEASEQQPILPPTAIDSIDNDQDATSAPSLDDLLTHTPHTLKISHKTAE